MNCSRGSFEWDIGVSYVVEIFCFGFFKKTLNMNVHTTIVKPKNKEINFEWHQNLFESKNKI